MGNDVHIGEAARVLGVSPYFLRRLEREGKTPPARRGQNGRVYSHFDLTLLKAIGVGCRPRKLRRVEEVLGKI
jgi:DNA-binding transcriptional MerR regulator